MSAQSIIDWTPLETLRIADPDTHVRVKERISRSGVTPSARALTILAEETVNGLAQETGFGQAVADGLLYLIVQSSEEHMDSYVASVRETAETGVTLGRIMAAHLAPVLAADSGLADVFRRTMAVMRQKGTYTLKPPLSYCRGCCATASRLPPQPISTCWQRYSSRRSHTTTASGWFIRSPKPWPIWIAAGGCSRSSSSGGS